MASTAAAGSSPSRWKPRCNGWSSIASSGPRVFNSWPIILIRPNLYNPNPDTGEPMAAAIAKENELKLTLKQQVKAPPARVFEALLDPKQVCQWMGPRSMVESCEVMSLDARVGGRYRLKMNKRADAPSTGRPATLFVTGVYQQIDRPNRLAYSWMWEDQQHESHLAFELKPNAGGTEVTLIHEGFANIESMQGHNMGWTASLQQLAALLETA